ncbi:MAG: N-acetylglucosamine-6-phosphate deacetylase [Planctomycetota bacterium]
MTGGVDLLVSGATVITPELAVNGNAVAAAGGKIVFVGPASEAPAAEKTVEVDGGFLLPGFVDLHCHGAGGYDATSGRYDRHSREFVGDAETLREGMPVIAGVHLEHGTTTLALATCAAPEELLLRALAAIGELAESGSAPSRVLGVNLEGTYLKDRAYAGAQNPEFFRRPETADFDRLNEAARGRIRIANVTADWGYLATDLITHLISNDVVASCGHSGGGWSEMKACIDAGTTLAVHFSNGPSSTSYKPPGKVNEALLDDRRVTLELIADGYHVNPRYLLSFLKAKDFRAALVTDAMLPVGAEDISRFTDCGLTGEKTPDGGVLRLQGTEDTLFGSLLTMDRAVANVARWLVEGVHGVYQNAPVLDSPPTLEEALVVASRLASGYPAEVMNLRRELGAIEAGLAADLVLLGEDLSVQHVWLGGKEVGAKDEPSEPAAAAEAVESAEPN